MRHQKTTSKLGRTSSHRKAMFRNMVTSLFKYDRIRTTDVKAKELRGWADHIIGLAKRGDLHARRQALAIMREKQVVHKLFAEVGERFGDRTSGYTRIIKMGFRPGDKAPVSMIELIGPGSPAAKKTRPAEAPKTEAVAAPAVEKIGEPESAPVAAPASDTTE